MWPGLASYHDKNDQFTCYHKFFAENWFDQTETELNSNEELLP